MKTPTTKKASSDRVMHAFRIPAALSKRLAIASEKTRLKQTTIVEIALENYFKGVQA